MANQLVDTNVIAELARPKPNRGVLAWASSVAVVAISVITIEEVFFGLARKPNPDVRRWFEVFFGDCDIIEVTPAIAARAGEMRGQFRAEGKVRTQADMLIAATAADRGLALVTRNVRDFQGCRIPTVNPFQ